MENPYHHNAPPRNTTNVVNLRPTPAVHAENAFNTLTARLVLAQHRAGTLSPAVVKALLLGVGLRL